MTKKYVKEPHTAIFSGPTSCGKTKLMLDLIESEYKQHFDNIIILCPTISWNATYLERSWLWNDDDIYLINPHENLIKYISQLSKMFAGEASLFIIDDCISNTELDKTRSSLLNLAISGRHKNHYLWCLTQRYTKIPLTVRDQLKQLFIWHPKNKKEFNLIHEENDVIDSDIDLKMVKQELKNGAHNCLYLRLNHPRGFKII